MKKLLLLLLVVIAASSCTNREEAKPKQAAKPSAVYRVGIGMMEKHALFNRGFTFQLQEGDPFQPLIEIKNEMPEASVYELFFLLDYKQIAVNYEGKPQKKMRLETAANAAGKLQVELAGLPSGRHELLVVAVRNPDKPFVEGQMTSTLQAYYYRRATLLIGSDKAIIEPAFQDVGVGQLDGPKTRNVFLTKGKPTNVNDMLKRFKHEPGSSYYLHFFTRPEVEKYAVTALVNNEQIEQPVPVQYLRKTELKEGVVSLLLAFEPQAGLPFNELTLIVVENPFERIEDDSGAQTKIPWSVYFNNKITVE